VKSEKGKDREDGAELGEAEEKRIFATSPRPAAHTRQAIAHS